MSHSGLAPFKSRNVLLYITGDLSFFLSFWLIYINVAWLVYGLTKSSLSLGVLGAMFYLPPLLLMSLSGVLADRILRHNAIVIAQASILLPVMIFAWLSYRHELSYRAILILSFIFSSGYSFYFPFGNAYLQDLIEDKAHTHRIMGFINTNTRTSQFVSSALNSLIHLAASFSAVFLVACVFNIIAVIAFFKINKKETVIEKQQQHFLLDLKEGFGYVFNSFVFWPIILLAITVNVFVCTYQFQLPVFVGKYLNGSIHAMSYLYTIGGAGGILGGVYLSIRKYSKHLMRFTALALLCTGIALALFALSRNLLLSMALSFIIDGGYVLVMAGTSATLMILVNDAKRGRAMGIYYMLSVGLIPFGNIAVGALAAWLTAPVAIVSVGSLCVIAAIWYLIQLPKFRQMVQPIYHEKKMTGFQQPI